MDGKEDEVYFASYEDLEVHKLMLKDEARVAAYMNYMQSNCRLFEDKVVLDVGAGTGILSLLAARAGARHVFAIEASNVSHLCRSIVAANGYSDKITVIHASVESIASLPGNVKADILVSEWMGFFLLHESMLSSVIAARDRFLAPDGLIVPSAANIYLCPVSLKQYHHEQFSCWKGLYGFDFTAVGECLRATKLTQPQIMAVTPECCIAEPQPVVRFELMYVDTEDLRNIHADLDFRLTCNSLLHGFACWFDVEFEGDVSVKLDTAPGCTETHWKQSVILLPDTLLVNKADTLKCNIRMQQDASNARRYNISIDLPEDDDDDDDSDASDDMDHSGKTDNVNSSEVTEVTKEIQDHIKHLMN